jgi:DNA-binding IclR family transcriptional regulator
MKEKNGTKILGQEARATPLERYFRIIEVLCGVQEGLSLNEIAILLGLPRQSAHRLLATMRETQLVDVTGGRNQIYAVAERVRRLATLALSDALVQSLTVDVLRRLSAEVGETSYIARLVGTSIRSVAMESPDVPWRGYVLPGKILLPHATASGKAIMAYQQSEIIENALSGKLEKPTAKTMNKTETKRDYGLIRERGYATCIGEVNENLAATAVPVFINELGVQFSLGIVGPLERITKLLAADVPSRMKHHAKSLSSALSISGRNREHELSDVS